MKREKRCRQTQLRLTTFFIILFSLFFCIGVYVQDGTKTSKALFVAPVTEVVYYGLDSPINGYGAAIGTEGGVAAIGLRGIYGQTFEKELTVLEVTIFARVYMFKTDTPKGLFIQFNIGPALFSNSGTISIPAEGGMLSIGFSAGWRFLLGDYFFIEPYLRAGYPYLGGGGLSAGIRL